MPSIPPQPADNAPEPTVRGVALLMMRSPDPFTAEVGALIEQIIEDHAATQSCQTCSYLEAGACATYEQATTTAIAWLLKVVEERG